MVPAPFRVVLDANVLFPFSLRDTLLRAAAAGYYQVCWSEEILEEARRNLVGRGTITEEQAHRLLYVMRRAFPEAMVSGHEPLTEAMPNDPKDRHVAAAAVRAAAQVIVTFNLKDFQTCPRESKRNHRATSSRTSSISILPASPRCSGSRPQP
jgi:predicted nucleic acid-binding protein